MQAYNIDYVCMRITQIVVEFTLAYSTSNKHDSDKFCGDQKI